MIVVGTLLATIMGLCLVKFFSLNCWDFVLLVTIAGGVGIIGAKLFYIILSAPSIDWNLLFHDRNYLNELIGGGFVFYGGLICGVAVVPLVGKLFHIDVVTYVKKCIPCIPLVHAFGRIGCHLAGCCYGIEYDGKIAIEYEHSLIAPNHVRLFPVQMIEAILELVICLILLDMIMKGSSKAPIWYVLLYSVGRFVLEFFRGDVARGSFWIFSTSQWISLVLIVLCVFFYFKIQKRHGKQCDTQSKKEG